MLRIFLVPAPESSNFYSLPFPQKFSLRIRVAVAAKDWKCLVTSSRASHQSILLFCDDEDNTFMMVMFVSVFVNKLLSYLALLLGFLYLMPAIISYPKFERK